MFPDRRLELAESSIGGGTIAFICILRMVSAISSKAAVSIRLGPLIAS